MFVEEKKAGEVENKPVEQWRCDLLKAAKVLRSLGHCKHILHRPGDGYCVMGALNMAQHNNHNYDGHGVDSDASEKLFRHLDLVPVESSQFPRAAALVAWNNAPERTKEEVIAALEGAARS
jgi:hypothetical protein